MSNAMCVARVRCYSKDKAGKVGAHNERKNINYANPNVDPERSFLNFSYATCGDKTYNERVDELVAEGKISLRGLKPDAKLLDEMLIDVNSEYFENHGGYEFAKKFYESAFRFAQEQYGKDNILSAVLHADEINKTASEKYGHPVYHYHMHVVALPVVEKEIRYSKRCRDPALVGTVKEVIHQVSHSKKWKSSPLYDEEGLPVYDEKGQPVMQLSYSLLQDQLAEHFWRAGYLDIERGERNSDRQHLSSLEYQAQLVQKRLDAADKELADRNAALSELNRTEENVERLKDAGKETLTGKMLLSKEEYNDLSRQAREGVSAKVLLEQKEAENKKLKNTNDVLKNELATLKKHYDWLIKETEIFFKAMEKFPKKVARFFERLISPQELNYREIVKGEPDGYFSSLTGSDPSSPPLPSRQPEEEHRPQESHSL